MKYRAIIYDPNDELKHWKYIKRVKGKDGKWQYFYKDNELRKYKIGLTETSKNRYGRVENIYTTAYKQGNSLFDKEQVKIRNRGLRYNQEAGEWYYKTHYVNTVKTQGILSRAAAKGEKWIFDNLISDKKKK